VNAVIEKAPDDAEILTVCQSLANKVSVCNLKYTAIFGECGTVRFTGKPVFEILADLRQHSRSPP
jgi:hypothetical protein